MSLVSTLMQPLRARYPNNFDQNEDRLSLYGAWQTYKRSTAHPNSILNGDIRDKIKMSDPGLAVQVPAIDAGSGISIHNIRSCTIPSDELTSRLISLSFETFVFSIEMLPAEHENNDIKYRETFERKMLQKLKALSQILDLRSITNLENNKNTYYPTAITSGFYPVTSNTLRVTQAQRDDYYNNLKSVFAQMDFEAENYYIIGSTTHDPMVNKFINQGSGNSTNLTFQFGGYDFTHTNRITNGSGVQSTAFSVVPGNIAVETRIDIDARMGNRIDESQFWERVRLPIIDVEAGAYYNKECYDASSGHTGRQSLSRTMRETYEFSFDLTFMHALNSSPTTDYSPILKTEILST